MSDALKANIKILIDEDMSPFVATLLRQEEGIDAIHIRERNLLGALDHQVLDLAFKEDRILVTANVRDFVKLCGSRELHAGIVLVQDGGLLRNEQLTVIIEAIVAIQTEIDSGRDMVNRVLRISYRGIKTFENLPP